MNVFAWLPDRIALIEIVWFLTGLLPLLRDLRFLWGLRRDQLTLRRDGKNGADDITIMTHIGLNWFIAFGHGVIVAVGVIAMALPPSVPDPDQAPSLLGYIVTAALFLLSATFTGITFWNGNRWATIVRYMKTQSVELHTVTALIAKVDALGVGLAENTAVSTHAAERAESVYHISNDMNAKLLRQTELGNRQADERREVRAGATATAPAEVIIVGTTDAVPVVVTDPPTDAAEHEARRVAAIADSEHRKADD